MGRERGAHESESVRERERERDSFVKSVMGDSFRPMLLEGEDVL